MRSNNKTVHIIAITALGLAAGLFIFIAVDYFLIPMLPSPWGTRLFRLAGAIVAVVVFVEAIISIVSNLSGLLGSDKETKAPSSGGDHRSIGGVTINNTGSGEAEVDHLDASVTAGGDIVGGDQTTTIHNYLGRSPLGQPLQRPPRAEHFTDRDNELKQLLTDLQPGKVATLCGPGGIGKTALAAEAIWTLAPADTPPERFPDGIIFHSFYNQSQVDFALEHIARTFGEEPLPTPQAAAQRALAGKRVLVVLDGAEDADNLAAVQQVLGGCGGLVTSRNNESATGQWRDIERLPLPEAIKLLKAWGQSYAEDDEAVTRICVVVDGLPLAVRLVGRYLKQKREPAPAYLTWLGQTPLEALNQGTHREENVNRLIKRSVAQVGDTAGQVLAVAGRLALAPLSRAVLAAALALPEGELRRALDQLVSYGLLLRDGDRYEVSHALIHTYARERLELAEEDLGRLVGYYDAWVRARVKEQAAGFREINREQPHLLRLIGHCAAVARWAEVTRLAWAMDAYFFVGSYRREWIEVASLARQAAQEQADRYDEGAFLQKLGTAYSSLGEVEKAIGYHEQALTISREIGDRQGEGNHLGSLGNAYRALGKVEKAIGYYEQGLAISRAIGHQQGEGNRLGNLGTAYYSLGEVEKAIGYHEQALTISREIGDRQGEGNRLGNLGNAYSSLGEVEKAIGYYEQALALSREIGHRQGEGNRLGNLGTAYYSLGEVEKAKSYMQQALGIFEAIKSPYADQARRSLSELDQGD